MGKESSYVPVIDFAAGDTIRGVQSFLGTPVTKNFKLDSVPARIPWSSITPEGVVVARIGALHFERTGTERRIWIKDGADDTSTGWIKILEFDLVNL